MVVSGGENTEGEREADAWITLRVASDLLGVSPSTVRRWADAGRIPTRRTRRGHRRLDAAAVRALQQRESAAARAMLAVEGASPRALARQAWHARFDDPAVVERMRGLGQRLLGLLIQYLVWQGDGERFLNDGRAVGADYGRIAHAAGVGLRETVQAFLYFRGVFWRTALQMPAVTQASDVAEVMRISERIDHFMNEVLLSTIAAYE